VTVPARGLSRLPGGSHPCVHPHRRNGDLADPAHPSCCRPCGADAEALACEAMVSAAGVVHSSLRGRVGREHRERLLRRHAVPCLDVSECWRQTRRPGGSGFAAGAAVQGVAGVAS
jgi:hypothetical protein